MPGKNEIYLFRMTHVDNISHVIAHGVTRAHSVNAQSDYRAIGDGSLIQSRADRLVGPDARLRDYIPFYFGVRMPMLYVIQHGYNGVTRVAPNDIVFVVSTVSKIVATGAEIMFTNGHAASGLTSFFTADKLPDIKQLVDFKAVEALQWGDDLDLKRRKAAEFLVKGDIPYTAISGFVVFDEDTKQKLLSLNIAEKIIAVRPKFYF
ncbi:MAG: DUF4433 domain-containing protein [Chitinophagia bacterium]|nr:DUF4433 domain-containing protein [Chitinophagia bacterium]